MRLIELMPETEEISEASVPKHRLAFGLLAVLLLPVLYVLSVGPAGWIFNKTELFRSTAAQHFF